jgi:hypothetical protein
MIVQIDPLDFRIGQARVLDLHFLSTDPQPILSSTDASPAVLHVPEHGFTTGDILRIYDHTNIFGKESLCNGAYACTVIDGDHFSIVVANNGKGSRSGYVGKARNLTSETVAAQIRYAAEESSTSVHTYSGELRVAPYTNGHVRLTLTDEQADEAPFVARQGLTVSEAVQIADSTGQKVEEFVNTANVYGRTVQ